MIPARTLCYKLNTTTNTFSASPSSQFTCEQAEETFAAQAVPHKQRVGRAPLSELHVDGLGAQAHLQVAQLHNGVAVPLLQPVRELVLAGKESTT